LLMPAIGRPLVLLRVVSKARKDVRNRFVIRCLGMCLNVVGDPVHVILYGPGVRFCRLRQTSAHAPKITLKKTSLCGLVIELPPVQPVVVAVRIRPNFPTGRPRPGRRSCGEYSLPDSWHQGPPLTRMRLVVLAD